MNGRTMRLVDAARHGMGPAVDIGEARWVLVNMAHNTAISMRWVEAVDD